MGAMASGPTAANMTVSDCGCVAAPRALTQRVPTQTSKKHVHKRAPVHSNRLFQVGGAKSRKLNVAALQKVADQTQAEQRIQTNHTRAAVHSNRLFQVGGAKSKKLNVG